MIEDLPGKNMQGQHRSQQQKRMNIRGCLEVLELGSDATPDDVNRAYRDLVTVWHPDRFSANPRLRNRAEEKLKELNQAYENALKFISTDDRHADPSGGTCTGAAVKGVDGENSLFCGANPSATETQSQPYRRFSARLIDYLLLLLIFRIAGTDILFPSIVIRSLIFPVFLSLAWIIPEAVCLNRFGTTPGKWLLKIVIVDIFQLKPGFPGALRRSLSVWCNGMGMGVLFIFPITALFSWFRLKIKGCTVWDRDGRFSVKYGRMSALRVVVTALFCGAVCYVVILGPNIMIEAYRQAVRIRPHSPEVHFKLGASYEKAGCYDKAAASYRKALGIRPEYFEACKRLGFCYNSLQRYDEALTPLKKALEIKPDDWQVWHGLGSAYRQLHRPEMAVEALQHAVRFKPDDAQILHELGTCYIQLGNYDKAIEMNSRAVEIRPDFARAYSDLGLCCYRTRRPEKAIRYMRKALKINPDDARNYYRAGLCYMDLGHYDRALKAFEKAVRIRPGYAEGFYGMGICYAKLGQDNNAIEQLRKAIRTKPDYAGAHHILGLMYLSLGDRKSAFKQYTVLKSLNSDLARELRNYIDNMPVTGGR